MGALGFTQMGWVCMGECLAGGGVLLPQTGWVHEWGGVAYTLTGVCAWGCV